MGWYRLSKHYSGVVAGTLSALLTAGLLKTGAWQGLERAAHTQLFRWRGPAAWSSEVVVIGIDEASLETLGAFPWPRARYTELLTQIMPADPSVIAFDIVFAEPSADDEALAAVMQAQGRVVLAQGWDGKGQLVTANNTLKEAALTYGHIQHTEDSDGLTRQIQPYIKGDPAFSVAISQVYALTHAPLTKIPRYAEASWINWSVPTQQIPHYSYSDVLSGSISQQHFNNKIVLIGVTATGLDNNLATPFDRNPRASGVYLHATVIHNVLQQNFLRVPDWYWQWVILLVGGPGLGWLFGNMGRWQQLGGCGAIALIWLLTSYGLFHSAIWLPVAWPMGLLGITLGTLIISAQLQAEHQLQHILLQISEQYDFFPSLNKRTQTTLLTENHPSLLKIATDLREVTNQVTDLILTDELTEIGNRRYFERCLSQEWKRAIREQTSLSILMCDVDFFKGFNDTYGHPVGDRCLQQVAKAIRSSVMRPADCVARYGGEEFVVILPNTPADGAVHVANNIRGAISSLKIEHVASLVNEYVTVSIGIASTIPARGSSPDKTLAAADRALYAAKEGGRDRASLHIPLP